MYKFIFADDERLVRNNIRKMIDLESVGFSLIGCCANGYDLLEMIEKEVPDLVIIDINMPFVSGIEAAEQIRNSYPHVKIIFLTGYTEFDYAKKAIDLGALRYIVKPISPDELASVLNEVRMLLEDENEKMAKIAKLAKLEHAHKTNQKLLLRDLISQVDINETIYERVNTQGFNWDEQTLFQVAVLSLDKIKNHAQWQKDDEEVMLSSLCNVTAELVDKNHLGVAYRVDPYVVLLGYGSDKIKLEIGMQECIGRILHITSKILKFKIIAGLGDVCTGCESIQRSFEQGTKALELGTREGANKLYTKEDLQNSQPCETIVWHAINYIKVHYADPGLSVEALSAQLHISASYLRSLFKRQTGNTIIGYITKIRMDQALEILNMAKLKNSEIAELVGYTDVHYFSYCFKKYFGVNTADIRKQLK